MKNYLLTILLVVSINCLYSQPIKCSAVKISAPDSFIKIFENHGSQLNMLENYYTDNNLILFRYIATKVVVENNIFKTIPITWYWNLDLATKKITYVELPDHEKFDTKQLCNCYEVHNYEIGNISFELKTVGNAAADGYETEIWYKTKEMQASEKINLKNGNFHHVYSIFKSGNDMNFIAQDVKDNMITGKIEIINKKLVINKINMLYTASTPVIQAAKVGDYYIFLDQCGVTGGTNPIVIYKCQ